MKTILVTGGAGFIGSHVVDELINNKYKVVVLDNVITGKKSFVNKKAIFVRGDISDKKSFERVFKKYKFYAVLHIAGQPSIVNAFSDPILDINTNFLGTVNATMLCIKYGVQRFLYASSMTLYGDQKELPIKETAPANPINYYGVAKFASERFVHITANRLDLKKPFRPTSFRMFNVFGPRQSLTNPYQGVLAIFMGKVLRHEPITIFGDGKHARDFIYVKDVAKIWVDAIDNKDSFGKAFNIGSGKMISVNKLAETVISACGEDPKKYKISRKPERSGNQRFVEADMSFAKKHLKIKPNYTFEEGLKETLAWARETK